MQINIQSILENDDVVLYPLQEQDFQQLYSVASNPEIWEQHPNKDRWKEDVFQTFFDGAMQSKGAFKIVDKSSQKVLGSTRFYDYSEQTDSIFIGYTFYDTAWWGKGVNQAVKNLMLNYIFQFVSKVNFHVGSENIRSQIAVQRLGAVKVAEQQVTYFGEQPKLNFVYEIDRNLYKINTVNF